jgi:hypothetical protein
VHLPLRRVGRREPNPTRGAVDQHLAPNWLRQDPVVAIETQANSLRKLKALYIDCGEKDQFNAVSPAIDPSVPEH